MLHYYDLRSFTLFNHRNVQTGILIILRNITTLKETQLALQEMAITDPLTGLHNRRHFFQIAGQEIERSLRYGHPLTAIMIDIDHFKQVNDTCGHIDGDQVLRSLAMCLQQNTRLVVIHAATRGRLHLGQPKLASTGSAIRRTHPPADRNNALHLWRQRDSHHRQPGSGGNAVC